MVGGSESQTGRELRSGRARDQPGRMAGLAAAEAGWSGVEGPVSRTLQCTRRWHAAG